MSISLLTDLNSHVTAAFSLAPQAFSGAADVNGTGIDRLLTSGDQDYLSAVIVAQTGAATGGPATQQIVFRIQDSADNASFADYIPDGVTSVPSVTITAVNTAGQVGVNLKKARRYVRLVGTPTFSGGASPTLLASGELVLGGAQKLPTP